MCESGAKSPEAPSEPFSGIIGVIPAFNIFKIVSVVSSLIPEKPFARLFARRTIIPLAISSGSGLPTPHEWLMIRFF